MIHIQESARSVMIAPSEPSIPLRSFSPIILKVGKIVIRIENNRRFKKLNYALSIVYPLNGLKVIPAKAGIWIGLKGLLLK